jgi:hypothetical protein
MARFGNAQTANDSDTPQEGTPKERSDFYEIIGKIIDIGVKIVGTPIYIIAPGFNQWG